eukprot:s2772_g2.t1
MDLRKHGDIFPMPFKTLRSFAGGVDESFSQRAYWIGRSLNKLAMHDRNSDDDSVLCSELPFTATQRSAADRIVQSLELGGPCPDDLTPEVALQSMKGGMSCYDGLPPNLASYDPDKLKILANGTTPRHVVPLLPPEAAVMVRNYEKSILAEPPLDAGSFSLYWDPSLRFNRALRLDFILRLFKAGLMTLRPVAKSFVSAFFLKKKDKAAIRMVIDCRATNQLHTDPPVTRLASGRCYADLDLSEAGQAPLAYGREADVADCFYRFGLPELSHYFAFDHALTAGEWEAFGVPASSCYDPLVGKEVKTLGQQKLYPCLQVIPMGWSWALWLANEAVVNISKKHAPWVDGVLRERKPTPQLCDYRTVLGVYVDNITILGKSASDVDRRAECLQRSFDEVGVPIVWTQTRAATKLESVGLVLDFEKGVLSNKPQRLWRFYLSTLALLKRRKLKGEVMQIWSGHFTAICSLAACGLSVLDSVYRFIEVAKDKRVKVWSSVRREMKIAAAVCWLVWRRLDSATMDVVEVGDSSTSGYAMTCCYPPRHLTQRAMKVHERWRFVAMPSELKKCLEEDDPVRFADALASVFDIKPSEVQNGGDPRTFTAAGLTTSYAAKAFEAMREGSVLATSAIRSQVRARAKDRVDIEVPALVEPLDEFFEDGRNFRLLWARRWRNCKEHITLKEARVALSSLRKSSRVASAHHCRKLTLSDNLGCVCAFSKGRSSNRRVNALCRRATALQFATGILWHLRHVETKRNAADRPSRYFENKHSKKGGFAFKVVGLNGGGISREASAPSKPLRPYRPKIERDFFPRSSGRFFLEIFSGTGRLSDAIRKQGVLLECALPNKGPNSQGQLVAKPSSSRGLKRPAVSECSLTTSPLAGRAKKRGRRLVNPGAAETEYDRIMKGIRPERLLRVKRISAKTVVLYNQRVTEFLSWASAQRVVVGSSERRLDINMSKYFNELYEDGEAYNVASYTLFGFIALKMSPKRPEKELLPLARSALNAWKASTPCTSRVGVPPQVIYRFACFCLENGDRDAATAALIQYDLYLRPSEILQLKGRDIVKPVANVSQHWGVLIGNSDFEEVSKTGTTDDIVVANSAHRTWCNDLVRHVAFRFLDQDVCLFGITLNHYEKLFREFTKAYKLTPQCFTPHTIRHSGPSFDALHEHRALGEIQARGRWASATSVQRYRKPGRLLMHASRLPAGLKRYRQQDLDSALRTILGPSPCRVALRFRPRSRREAEAAPVWRAETQQAADMDSLGVLVQMEQILVMSWPNETRRSRGEDVYRHLAAELPQRALEGIASTLLCYGASGTGKSFSLLGMENDGLIPRTSADLFEQCRELDTVIAEFRDLLRPSSERLMLREVPGTGGGRTVLVPGASTHLAASAEELRSLLDAGLRQLAVTQIFTIHVARLGAEFTVAYSVARGISCWAGEYEAAATIQFVHMADSARSRETRPNRSVTGLMEIVTALARRGREETLRTMLFAADARQVKNFPKALHLELPSEPEPQDAFALQLRNTTEEDTDLADDPPNSEQESNEARKVAQNNEGGEKLLSKVKMKKMTIRAVMGVSMMVTFGGIIYLGHLYLCTLVFALQCFIFSELVGVRKRQAAEKRLPLFRSIQWAWFFVASFFTWSGSICDFVASDPRFLSSHSTATLRHGVEGGRQSESSPASSWYVDLKRGTVSVLSLRKGLYKYQITQYTWTVVTICIVVFQTQDATGSPRMGFSGAVFHLIYAGLFWFVLPSSLVICNDIMAYYCGQVFGKKSAFFTMLFAFWFSRFWAERSLRAGGHLCGYKWMTCAPERITFSVVPLNCEPDQMYRPQSIAQILYETMPRLHAVEVFAGSVPILKDLGELEICQAQIHALSLGFFASFAAPFGGFLSSAIKRAYGIKDFNNLIPGHGGMMDRFDCQFVMFLCTFPQRETGSREQVARSTNKSISFTSSS